MRNKPYDYYRVIKTTIIFMLLLIVLATICNLFFKSNELRYFIFGSLIVIIIFLIVINITYKFNMKLKNKKISKERLLQIARKMHLWIFLHSDNEQEIYDELGLTEEENKILGYSGQIKLNGEDNE